MDNKPGRIHCTVDFKILCTSDITCTHMYVYVLTRKGGGERRAEDRRIGRRRERREKEGKEKGEKRKKKGKRREREERRLEREREEGRKRCWYSLILMFPTVQFLRMQKWS